MPQWSFEDAHSPHSTPKTPYLENIGSKPFYLKGLEKTVGLIYSKLRTIPKIYQKG